MTSINGIHTRVLVNAIGMFAPQFSADGLTWFCAGPNCLTWTTANAVCIRLKWFADLIPEVGKVVTKMPDHEIRALFPTQLPSPNPNMSSTELAVQPKASDQLAARLGVEKGMMIETIKSICFKGMRPEQVTDTQLAAHISICNTLELNPLLPGMIYAYPSGNGSITPIVGPDGVMKKLAELKGVTYECIVYPEDVTQPPTHAIASIYVEGKPRPYTYTAVYSEWVTNNWAKRPRHFNWLRALKQCARQVIHGLPMDEEEATIAGMINVTDSEQTEAPRAAKASRKSGAAATSTEPAPVETVTPPAPKKEPVTVDAEVVPNEPSEADFAKAEAEAKATAARVEKQEAARVAAAEKTAKAEAAAAAAKKKAEADAAAARAEPADLSKVPEVAPGIGINQFLGRSYPVTLTGTIDTLTPKVAGTTCFVTMTVSTPQGRLDIVSFGGVKALEGGKLDITNSALRVGALIEFSLEAKLRKSALKDAAGKPLPDLTKPPALIASHIKDCEESPI